MTDRPASPCDSPARTEPPTVRLLSLRQAAAYVGCSYWSIRDWCLGGILPTVDLPPLRARGGERPRTRLRRVLIDRVDLDAFIERHKRKQAREHER